MVPRSVLIALLASTGCAKATPPLPPERTAMLVPVPAVGSDNEESWTPVDADPDLLSTTSGPCALAGGRVWCTNNLGAGLYDADSRSALPLYRRIGGIEHSVSLACGRDFCCVLGDGGRVTCFGENDHGQAGNQHQPRSSSVNRIDLPAATAIFAANKTACARVDARLACWGEAWDAAGRPRSGPDPQFIEGLDDVADAAITAGHGCARTRSGQLWCWGRGTEGQFGERTEAAVPPHPIPTEAPIALLRVRPGATAYATADGSTRVLGRPTAVHDAPPVKLDPTVVSTRGGPVLLWSPPTPAYEAGLTEAVEVAPNASCVRGDQDVLRCWRSSGVTMRWVDLEPLAPRERRSSARTEPPALSRPYRCEPGSVRKPPIKPAGVIIDDTPTKVLTLSSSCDSMGTSSGECTELGFLSGRYSCEGCQCDILDCQACDAGMECEVVKQPLDSGHPVLAAARRPGETAVVWSDGGTTDLRCGALTMAFVGNGTLTSPVLLGGSTTPDELSLTGTSDGWLLASRADDSVTLWSITPAGIRQLGRLEGDRAQWAPMGNRQVLLVNSNDQEPPKLVAFESGVVVAGSINLWERGDFSMSPAIGRAADDRVFARMDRGFSGEPTLNIVRVDRDLQVVDRTVVSGWRGRAFAIIGTDEGYRVWSSGDEGLFDSTVVGNEASHRQLDTSLDLAGTVPDAHWIGDRLWAIVEQSGRTQLAELGGDSVTAIVVRHGSRPADAVVTDDGLQPVVIWSTSRFRGYGSHSGYGPTQLLTVARARPNSTHPRPSLRERRQSVRAARRAARTLRRARR